MELYVKQKVFSFGDKFGIFDENGNTVYTASGEVFSFGKKLHIRDNYGNEKAYIVQKLFRLFPTYEIYLGGELFATVRRNFSFIGSKYTVSGRSFSWDVTGNFTGHSYDISQSGSTVASVGKKWFTWGDTYEVSTRGETDPLGALCVLLVIDCCVADDNNN